MDKIISQFIKKYGETSEEIRVFHAPGRVNLIGEHIDYNGGNVFPCALDFGTYAVVRKRNDHILNLASLNFELEVQVDMNDIKYEEAHDWGNYPKGVLKMLQNRGHELCGMDVLLEGNIPNGAGLSSSASVELVILVAANALNNLGVDQVELAKIGQLSENTFNGVNCGIMDQFAVAMGKENHAILLDCDTLEYEYAPLKLEGYKLVIANTNKRRQLNESAYNERRAECDTALELLQKQFDVKYLCHISPEEFEAYAHLIEDPVINKRAKHVITENARSLEASKALAADDLERFGDLMVESHMSLKEDYAVTGVELDTLVEEALKVEGVIGSRMTGAGFGGCTVSIVKEEVIDQFTKEVMSGYKERIGYEPTIYIAGVGDGAKEIERANK
ncbi:MAG TPA: galactokinase [Epulopiscium sp.]|nr:galactokinase [Candidatus Epulonipiscium sp.]